MGDDDGQEEANEEEEAKEEEGGGERRNQLYTTIHFMTFNLKGGGGEVFEAILGRSSGALG